MNDSFLEFFDYLCYCVAKILHLDIGKEPVLFALRSTFRIFAPWNGNL